MSAIITKKEALEAARDTEGLDMSFEPKGAEISSSGDMAFAYGEISMKLPDGSQLTEKYVTIWRKIDSKWQVVLQARKANSWRYETQSSVSRSHGTVSGEAAK
ncbi:nuclear transport factor 2 family protein [Marinobacter xestospongiae]|uniref:nuclear transport factor 2 family protein n=1 Tax=Marinobacter xestospongiae TaxID=994319 RepID=UPI002005226A|nr:nuclear transport factor 2 family protein [Marinobacter xestospongiae]MCK7568928.1 nuclear transport factor 2 family protein [Marinobacter xestospongiae]